MTVRTSINCDRVFDRLTAGQFPSGRADDLEVEKHIRICHSCREFAEAMRPAVDLIHESTNEYSADDLPSFQLDLDRIEMEPAPAHARTVETLTLQNNSSKAVSNSERAFLVAVLLIGVIVGAAITAGAIQGNSQAKLSPRLQANAPGNSNFDNLNSDNSAAASHDHLINKQLTKIVNTNCQSLSTVAKISANSEIEKLNRQNRGATKKLCCSNCHKGESIKGFSNQQIENLCKQCHG